MYFISLLAAAINNTAPKLPPEDIDWNKMYVLADKNGAVSYTHLAVYKRQDNVQAKLGATYDKSQVIKVYLTGISYNDNQGFRVWSGARNNSRTSNVESVNAGSKGVAFKREITLNPADKAEADTFDTILSLIHI